MKRLVFLTAIVLAIVSCAGKNDASQQSGAVFDEQITDTSHPVLLSEIDKLFEEYKDSSRDDWDVTVIKDFTAEDGTRIVYAVPCNKVCSAMIGVAVKDGVILEASFVRGCPGNSIGVAKLVQDMTVEDAISRLKGIDCSERGTSCPDQLARVLQKCK